jgi:hypothetical protein
MQVSGQIAPFDRKIVLSSPDTRGGGLSDARDRLPAHAEVGSDRRDASSFSQRRLGLGRAVRDVDPLLDPDLLIFLFFQRLVIEGIATTGMKH